MRVPSPWRDEPLVEVGEAGGHAVEAGLAVADRLDLVEDAVHDVRERRVVLATALVGDLEDLGLRLVDDVVDLALAGVADLHDAGAGVDQAAQDRLLAHDLGVVARVGGDRHVGREGVEVRRAADALELAASLQLGGDGDHVDRLAAAVEVDDRVVDRLVGWAVVVGAAQHLGDLGAGVLADQHRAEHRLLGSHVLRGRAVVRLGRPLTGRVGDRPVAPVLEGRLVEVTGLVLGDAHAHSLAGCRTTRGGAARLTSRSGLDGGVDGLGPCASRLGPGTDNGSGRAAHRVSARGEEAPATARTYVPAGGLGKHLVHRPWG